MNNQPRVGCPTIDRITEAERDVLQRLASGMTLTQIAAERGSHRVTVSVQLRNVRDKLGATTTEHAIVLALKKGTIAI